MFEVAVICIVLVATAYSAFLWRMGRRADVLHGEFIAPSSSPKPVSTPASTLDIEASLKSLLQTIERDLCESEGGVVVAAGAAGAGLLMSAPIFRIPDSAVAAWRAPEPELELRRLVLSYADPGT